MPWHVIKSDQCPASRPYGVIKDADGSLEGCHATKAKANKQLAALYAEEGNMASEGEAKEQERHSAGDLLRFQPAEAELFELRDSEGDMPTMVGHFAVFGQWAEIHSAFEGDFIERISPTAFDKTFAENRRSMRVLFQHGKDTQIGEKILGPIAELRAEDQGAYYEVPLFDTSYNRDLIPGLATNSYGASFRFRVMREEFERKPKQSEHNPEGLPERTITEAKVMEFGPVTFPAYEGATAGLRSATDWWLEQNLLSALEKLGSDRAAAPAAEEPSAPEVARRRTRPTRNYLKDGKEAPQWRL